MAYISLLSVAREMVFLVMPVDGLFYGINTPSVKGVIMTHNAKKCVQELLKSDGWSIDAKNLKDAATLFSAKQQGCCPKIEVLQMFRRAFKDDGTLVAILEEGVVVAYRALTDFEREQAEVYRRNDSLRSIRRKKARTPKPSSHRHNPAPPVLLDSDPVLEPNNEYETSNRESALVLS